MSSRQFLAAVAMCGLLAAEAGAQPSSPTPGAWDSLEVPGTVSALLGAAGLDPDRPRTTALRDVIRIIWASPEGTDEALDARRAALFDYFATLLAFDRALTAFGPDMPPLAQAADRDTRRKVETLGSAMGYSLERARGTIRLVAGTGDRQLNRQRALRAAGIDIDGLVAALVAGEPVRPRLASDDVPLPLPKSAWQAFVRSRREYAGSLAASILADRSASLIYFGLTAADRETRAYFAEHPAVVEKLTKPPRAGVFATYGGSFRIAGGVVAVPGGDAAVPLWEALAGESVSEPERFVPSVLDRDEGRLALLIDTATRLDGPRRAFLLGLWDPDAGSRLQRFKRLYEQLKVTLAGWDPRVRPFYRNRYDIAHVLAMTRVAPDGALFGLRSAGLWRRVFESGDLPPDAEGALQGHESDGDIDAAGVVEVLARLDYSAPRAETWWFGHRVFDAVPAAGLPDVFVALRGFERYRVLAATLERIGVVDPAVYAAAIRQADRLTALGDRERAEAALALFQGALNLVEHAGLGRVIDAARVAALVRSLSEVPLTDGEYRGGIARWIDHEYLPAVMPGLAPSGDSEAERSAEDLVLASLAGRALGPSDSAKLSLDLEGLSYVVDLAGARLASLREIRRKQHAVPLDLALDLARAAAALQGESTGRDRLAALGADLEGASAAVLSSEDIGRAPWFDRDGFKRLTDRAVGGARAVAAGRDPGGLAPALDDVVRAGDILLGHALVSLAYAPHLADQDGLLLLAGGPSGRHDWALADAPLDAPVPNQWLIPREDRSREGWYLKGSILGLDIALGEQALRRVVADRVPQAPTIKDSDRLVLTDDVVLANAFDCTDAGRDAVVQALGRGRARVGTLGANPSAWPELAADAGIDDLRRGLVEWTLSHEPDRVTSYLSLADLVRLGRDASTDLTCLDAWGASGRFLDGRWSLVFPMEQPFELLAGRRGSALVAALVPDLALALAEALASRGLPAVLMPQVMAAAAQDFIDEVRLAYEDDWLGMLALVPSLVARVDDYIAALTVRGPLRPGARRQ